MRSWLLLLALTATGATTLLIDPVVASTGAYYAGYFWMGDEGVLQLQDLQLMRFSSANFCTTVEVYRNAELTKDTFEEKQRFLSCNDRIFPSAAFVYSVPPSTTTTTTTTRKTQQQTYQTTGVLERDTQ